MKLRCLDLDSKHLEPELAAKASKGLRGEDSGFLERLSEAFVLRLAGKA